LLNYKTKNIKYDSGPGHHVTSTTLEQSVDVSHSVLFLNLNET